MTSRTLPRCMVVPPSYFNQGRYQGIKVPLGMYVVPQRPRSAQLPALSTQSPLVPPSVRESVEVSHWQSVSQSVTGSQCNRMFVRSFIQSCDVVRSFDRSFVAAKQRSRRSSIRCVVVRRSFVHPLRFFRRRSPSLVVVRLPSSFCLLALGW